jgi:hypothetical protein
MVWSGANFRKREKGNLFSETTVERSNLNSRQSRSASYYDVETVNTVFYSDRLSSNLSAPPRR